MWEQLPSLKINLEQKKVYAPNVGEKKLQTIMLEQLPSLNC